VPIAVIDSEIDVSHPDLEGVVTKGFDAVCAPEKPHAHGMAWRAPLTRTGGC